MSQHRWQRYSIRFHRCCKGALGIQVASKESTDETYAQLEDLITQGSSAAPSSIPIPDETMKNGDIYLKMAVAIHVTRASLESLLSGT